MVVLATLMDVGSKRDGPTNTHTRQPRDNNFRQSPQVVILFWQQTLSGRSLDGPCKRWTERCSWCGGCPLLTRVCGC